MPAPLVEEPQQDVERLPGRTANVVEYRHLGGEQASGFHLGTDQLASRPLLAADDRVAHELGQPCVAMKLAKEGVQASRRGSGFCKQSFRRARRTFNVHVLLGDERQHEALLQMILPNDSSIESFTQPEHPTWRTTRWWADVHEASALCTKRRQGPSHRRAHRGVDPPRIRRPSTGLARDDARALESFSS